MKLHLFYRIRHRRSDRWPHSRSGSFLFHIGQLIYRLSLSWFEICISEKPDVLAFSCCKGGVTSLWREQATDCIMLQIFILVLRRQTVTYLVIWRWSRPCAELSTIPWNHGEWWYNCTHCSVQNTGVSCEFNATAALSPRKSYRYPLTGCDLVEPDLCGSEE
jgi:hypothetical protein